MLCYIISVRMNARGPYWNHRPITKTSLSPFMPQHPHIELGTTAGKSSRKDWDASVTFMHLKMCFTSMTSNKLRSLCPNMAHSHTLLWSCIHSVELSSELSCVLWDDRFSPCWASRCWSASTGDGEPCSTCTVTLCTSGNSGSKRTRTRFLRYAALRGWLCVLSNRFWSSTWNRYVPLSTVECGVLCGWRV